MDATSTTGNGNGSDYGLKTLNRDGSPPECRFDRPEEVSDYVLRLIDADQKRSKVRAALAGLFDGNPPYSPAKNREAGRADSCNVNYGTMKATLDAGRGAFYDLVSEAPGKVEILTSHGGDEQREEYSRVMSEEADWTFRFDKSRDTYMQKSQLEMALYGKGPMFFDDPHVVFPMAIDEANLLLPDLAPMDLEEWEICAVLRDYNPPQLYKFIRNEQAAADVGWDPEYVKLVVMNAVDRKQADQRSYNWEWFQNEIKTNSFAFTDQDRVCKLAHVFWKEFDGRVTHVIVERQDNNSKGRKFLFKSVGRYDNFWQVIHPMYFDNGRGGLYHTVTGIGIPGYGPFMYENRLLCNQMDKVFAPKIFFTPATAEAAQKFQMARFGDWGMLPPGTTVANSPIGSTAQDGLAMFRTSNELMRSNMSQYRQQVQMDMPGNPDTATETRYKASESGALSNTNFAKYYVQLDCQYGEIVRRLCNLNTTDQRAKDFQKRCTDREVPRECFGRIQSVQAVRVIGQGSPFMRQQATVTIMEGFAKAPPNAPPSLLDDFIASHAGQSAVARYSPKGKISPGIQDQKERAVNQVSNAKNGLPPVVSQSQNPLVFASLFLDAGIQAAGSLKQGANPAEVSKFLDVIGPGILAHLKRLGGDSQRNSMVKPLMKQFERLAKVNDQIKKQMQAMQQKRQQQAQKTGQVLNDAQLKQVETMAKIRDRNIKTQATLRDKAVRSQQQRAIADANAASQIRLNHFRALNE